MSALLRLPRLGLRPLGLGLSHGTGGGGTPPPDPARRFWLFNSSGVYSQQASPTWDSAVGEVWQK